MQDTLKTLVDSETDLAMSALLKQLELQFGAVIRN
jgi:phenylalanyl-tRNA synthetase beta subunit